MRRLLLLTALLAATASAQQADITANQLLAGQADARLQQLAREAATAGRKLIISAPEYWHDLILEQLRRGGGDRLVVELRDSFADSVLVRSEALAGAAATPRAPVPVPGAAAPTRTPPPVAPRALPVTPTPPPAAPAPARLPPASPAPTAPAPSVSSPVRPPPPPANPAPRATTPAAAARVVAPPTAPAAVAPETAAAPAAAAAPPDPAASSAAAEIAAIRQRLERDLNGGQRVERSLSAFELEPGDVIYVRGPVKAVQRRLSLRSQLFWLDGEIELRRVELRALNPNRYQVMERIRNVDNVRLRAERGEERALFVAAAPERHAEERARLERRYNGGDRIEAVLAPEGLRSNDVLYVGDDLAVVVRVAGLSLERYWLIGRINLGRSELLRDGNNKYRVLAEIRR